jgi:methyl-accepting chemotaxis protein
LVERSGLDIKSRQKLVDQMAQQLSSIVQDAQNSGLLVAAIAGARAEQSHAVEELSAHVHDFEQSARDNAAQAPARTPPRGPSGERGDAAVMDDISRPGRPISPALSLARSVNDLIDHTHRATDEFKGPIGQLWGDIICVCDRPRGLPRNY